ncbi:sialic acid TRAP transporter substrate-binding protein SiaP [Aquisalibacillus elongatus]|uniref:Tripartite ATP-independent transporter DctP family solute receptor n=1 Tax=Aquisalibacillus elongatus TaxID=485577 RepID=A0A3N5C451_9BACI|nr:sialic acid TRAP transporter substrate-binding protein SiaP [Aquisalibacillus elongatus]RPF54242.1 tripartite ATP-independent transporter DctP family solute receptor [Aquisalibacillus elongatus]
MKLKKILFVLLFVGFVTLVACSDSSDDQSSDENEGNNGDGTEETFELNFSTASVPNDAHTEGLNVMKDYIEENTDGNVTVNVHHSGSLYSQDNEAQALMRGNLEMAYVSAPWVSEHIPSMSMFTSGYLFKDYDHMTNTFNGEIGEQVFEDVVDELGVRPLGAFYLGSRQLNYRDIGKEIRTPEDLEGVTLRMPNTDSWLFLGEALGANPTPVDFSELYMALNTGTVQAQDNPLPTVKNAAFHEVTDYITITDHVIDTVWPTINEEVWQSLPSEYQEVILESVEEARKYVDETNLDAESELVEFFESEGLTVIEADKDAFMERVQAEYLNNEEMTSSWDMDLYERIQEMAE